MIFWKMVGGVGRFLKTIDSMALVFFLILGSMVFVVGLITYRMLAATGEVVKCYTEIDPAAMRERLLIKGKIKGLPDKNLGYAATNKEAIEFIYTNPSRPESKEQHQ